MDHLEHPDAELWNARRAWFEQQEESARGLGAYLVSEQACGLIAEVQSVFCAGAWVAVLVLALAVVDAQLRETELPGFGGNTKKLIDAVGGDASLHALRLRRNALVHVDPDAPAITVDQQWGERASLERQAREAIEMMLRVFYMSPGT